MMSDRPNSTRNDCSLPPLRMPPASTATTLPSTIIRSRVWRPTRPSISRAVAQRKRLRLSTLVYVLPLHNPIRLIEEICLIDQLSNGRFEVGVGRGTIAQEWRMWGGDASENDARFEETLEVILKGLQCEFLSHSGKFYNFKDLWMELRPCQQPLPPFWYAGNAAHAGERARISSAGSVCH